MKRIFRTVEGNIGLPLGKWSKNHATYGEPGPFARFRLKPAANSFILSGKYSRNDQQQTGEAVTVQEYREWFDDAVAPTDRMIRLIPPDKLGWKLTDSSFTMGQLIDHLHKSLAFNAEVIAGREWPLKSIREILVSNRRHPESGIEEAAARFQEARVLFLKEIAAIGDERFRREAIDTPQRGKLPIWRFAAFVLEHHLRHMMELHIGLKVLGVKVNTWTLYSG